MPDFDTLSQQLEEALQELKALTERQLHFETILLTKGLSTADIAGFNPLLHRNFIGNADAAQQKNLMFTWKHNSPSLLEHSDLVESGFRAFSQNDEDGILLRLFTHIGCTNRYVIEIGSNCNDSDVGIPENLSTNLLVNHGWHGTIFELDATECNRMRYFFARTASTRHYHWTHENSTEYYSPAIVQRAISPENINELLMATNPEPEPDLFIIDIDGGDFAVMENLCSIKPRVIVVEFEKRFRERYSVVQRDREQFSRRWQQSGAASLTAWISLLEPRGYKLCTVGTCCFNAFFVREDIAEGKLAALYPKDAFDSHPVFSAIDDSFWLAPDESWQLL
ncbi:FkbM family methyltransferase [Pseudomonas chlororaphis subsp. aureofaciens]|uniref:FkbM family methyltransferase n=1 Tax=Pseudomonas chlororaphis TaxID=587753 RepID=UPI0018E90D77|nr:FkbM family methyltransferase [Pseudomonas chlororaphis]